MRRRFLPPSSLWEMGSAFLLVLLLLSIPPLAAPSSSFTKNFANCLKCTEWRKEERNLLRFLLAAVFEKCAGVCLCVWMCVCECVGSEDF